MDSKMLIINLALKCLCLISFNAKQSLGRIIVVLTCKMCRYKNSFIDPFRNFNPLPPSLLQFVFIYDQFGRQWLNASFRLLEKKIIDNQGFCCLFMMERSFK